MAKMEYDFDVAVVGGGSGGYAAARTVAAAGRKTLVIEGGEQLGGLCILRGCMPTKAFLYAAEVMHLARHAGTWGIQTGTVTFDWSKVMARKDELIKEFADYRVEQLRSGKFEFIRAFASFKDAHSLTLSSGQTVTARQIVIATGSRIAEPPLPELREVGYIDSDQAMTLRQLPESMIVLGGGAVAVEFAQFYARFGVKITLIQRSEQVLKEFDEDAAEALTQVFRREGMDVYTGTQLTGVRREGTRKIASFAHAGKAVEVAAEEIFMGLGRTPNTENLHLEQAGVETAGARIVTNARMQTTAPHIFAVGDCTGPHEIVHIAIQQGDVAACNIVRPEKPREIDYRLLTSVVFTEPQLACVGLTEKDARENGLAVLKASYPFKDHGKSLIMEAKDGFVKLLADPQSGEILGGCCVGPMGGDLIHEIVAAMHKRMTVRELAAMPHYHPTLAEIWAYPAEDLAAELESKT